jgi:hypothetical protein
LFKKAKQSNQPEYISFGFDQKFSSLRSKILGEEYTADQIQTKIDSIRIEIDKDKAKINDRFGGKNAQKRLDQNYLKLDELNQQFESSMSRITKYSNDVLELGLKAQSLIENK